MKNYKLLIQYDGTDFSGWQIQKNSVTIQGTIVNAAKILLKENINIIGSGRTDSGVHALGQVANFRYEHEIDIRKFQHSLNALLPSSISIVKMTEVNLNFNARFDAKKRTYFYLFSNIKSPFLFRFSNLNFSITQLNIEKLNSISKYLLGIHDFTSFSKTDSEIKNKICTIYSIRWKRSGAFLYFFVDADRFLHGMVRTIIGTLLYAYKQENPKNYIDNVFKAKNRVSAAKAVSAKGLFLYKVHY